MTTFSCNHEVFHFLLIVCKLNPANVTERSFVFPSMVSKRQTCTKKNPSPRKKLFLVGV